MSKALIKIVYRQVIDAKAETAFEKQVLKASYEEFLLKSQAYNREGEIKTFSAMKANDGRANSLHYKSGFAVDGYINLLQKKIPVLLDCTGQNIVFDAYRFEVLESDTGNPAVHTVAIWYYTETLTLLDQLGNHLLLVYGDKTEELSRSQPVENCFMLPLQVGMSVVEYSPISQVITATA